MDTSILSTYVMSIPDADAVQGISDELNKHEPATFDKQFVFNFNHFEIFRHNIINDHGPVLKLNDTKSACYLIFPEIIYRLFKGKIQNDFHHDVQTWGWVLLKNNHSHILIKSETLLDKIHDWIQPVELDLRMTGSSLKNF